MCLDSPRASIKRDSPLKSKVISRKEQIQRMDGLAPLTDLKFRSGTSMPNFQSRFHALHSNQLESCIAEKILIRRGVSFGHSSTTDPASNGVDLRRAGDVNPLICFE